MAFPPGVLPINRTNATPQLNTHAADHNAVNQAVNDIVPQVQTLLANKPAYWVGASQGGQSIAGKATATISWVAVNNAAWGNTSSPNLTVPAGGDGVYVMTARLMTVVPTEPDITAVSIFVGATQIAIGYLRSPYDGMTIAPIVVQLAAGNILSLSVYNGNSGAQMHAVVFTVARIAPLT